MSETMFRPLAVFVNVASIIPGAIIGYKLFGIKGALIGFFAGIVFALLIETIGLPCSLREEYFIKEHGYDLTRVTKTASGLFVFLTAIFVVFTPRIFRGEFLGYANQFIPLAMFLGCSIAFARLAQKHPVTEVRDGERIFLWPFFVVGWYLTTIMAFAKFISPA